MNQKKAKRLRQEMRANGIDPFPAPNHNVDEEAVDTREQRRTKRFRKRLFGLQTRQSSMLALMEDRAKWSRAFYPLFNAAAIKATNAAIREAEAEEVA